MSYRKGHIKSRINRIRPRKPLFRKLWFWTVLLVLAVIMIAVYFLLFYPGIQVKNIIISGNQRISGGDVQGSAQADIGTKIFSIGGWRIETASILFVNSGELSKQILNNFPAAEAVKVNKKFPQTLDIGIKERVAINVFCPDLSMVSTGLEKCFLMDENGIIFERALASAQGLTIVTEATGNGPVSMGQKVVAQNVMDLISKVEKNLKDNFQISLARVRVASAGRLDATTSENWQIYFDISRGSDTNLQLTKLNLLLSGGIPPAQKKNLRYIDLRPKDRAVICDNATCGGH